jgi:putative transposase
MTSGWQKPERTQRRHLTYSLKTYELKYPKATQCLEKDREELLAFYYFPADHWPHIRTTNPIESTFSSIWLRTEKTVPVSVE